MTHTEIDPTYGMEHAALEPLRLALSGLLGAVATVLHHDRPLSPGQQWTIPLGSSCGFAGRLIVQVDDLGTCAPVPVDPIERSGVMKALLQDAMANLAISIYGLDIPTTDHRPLDDTTRRLIQIWTERAALVVLAEQHQANLIDGPNDDREDGAVIGEILFDELVEAHRPWASHEDVRDTVMTTLVRVITRQANMQVQRTVMGACEGFQARAAVWDGKPIP